MLYIVSSTNENIHEYINTYVVIIIASSTTGISLYQPLQNSKALEIQA